MRRLLIIFVMALVPSVAMAAHGMGGGHMGGGHMGGGWGGGHMGGGWGGGHMGGGWGGGHWAGRSMAMVPGHVGGWHGANFHRGPFFRHNRFFFARRHHRFFFAGAPFFAAGYGFDSCWRWVPTAWGPRRVWVCGDFY